MCLVLSINVLAQTAEPITYSNEVKLGASPNIELNLYDITAEVLPSESQSLKIELEYLADGKPEELKRLKEAMQSTILTSLSGGNEVKVDLMFQSNFDLEIMGMKWSKVTFKSNKKESIKLKEFKVKRCQIWLPKNANIDLNLKYSNLKFNNDIVGSCKLDLYDSHLLLNNVSETLIGEAKYSSVKIRNNKRTSINLYECKFNAIECREVRIDAKYTDVNIDQVERLDMETYEGSLVTRSVNDAQLTSKYTSLKFDDVTKLNFSAYEGGLEFNNIGELDLNAKYLEIKGGNLSSLTMREGYENEIKLNTMTTIDSKEGKYNEFTISRLEKSCIVSGYEEELEIEFVGSDFEKIELKGKYIEANMSLENVKAHKITGNVQYPDIDLPEERYTIRRKIGDSNELEFLYEFGNVDESSPIIKIEGYEMDLKIQH